MKKLLILIFLSVSLSGYSQFVFKNGKSTARIDTIATNGNLFYFVNRTTNQICQAQVRNQALVVQNIYTFTDSLTTLRAFRDSINRLKLTLTGKVNYSDTISLLETVYHASQTYLKINPDSIVTNRIRLTGDTTNLPPNAAMTKQQVVDNINARMGSSTTYASDGVYMDGDTVKLDTIIGTPEGFIQFDKYHKYILLSSEGVNAYSEIFIDSTGIKYGSSVDTTLTTPTHLMTEQQVKREILSTDGGWRKRADATKYIGAEDSTVIKDYNSESGSDPGIYYYYNGNAVYKLTPSVLDITVGDMVNKLSYGGMYSSPLLAYSFNNSACFSYAATTNHMGMFINNADTIKYGRNYEGIHQGDYFYSTKHGSIGIVSNGVRTYEVDSTGTVYFKGTFAGIYVSDGSTAQSIPTGATYTKLTGFATNGESSNCTADVTNDKITITKIGRYFVNWSASVMSGTNLVTTYFTPFLGGAEQNSSHAARKIGVANDLGSMSGGGFINVTTVPVDLDLRARTDAAGSVDITPVYMNMTVQYVGN